MTVEARRAGARLQERLEVLAEIAALSDGRLPADLAARAADTSRLAIDRLGHGAAHTVVALAGATGSGKSSTFNAIIGRPLATAGVRRPTTSSTQAAVFSTGATLPASAAGLLSWLGVHQHAVVDDPALEGLVLLDLPDHDSTQAAHRVEVDRLVPIVDVFVWVVDPQKYADAALHHDYLRRFAGHAAVTIVVLNQIDTIAAAADRAAALADLSRILVADGLRVARAGVIAKVTGTDDGVRVMGASARTGEGIDVLRHEIAARVAAQRAFVDRIAADVDALADELGTATGERDARAVPERAVDDLGRALSGAAGTDAVAEAVAAAHRRRGVHAAGWPPTRWISKLKPDPLRRLGLDRKRDPRSGASDDAGARTLDRTSLPAPSPVATAAVSSAIRRVVDDVSTGLPDVWRDRLATVASSRRGDLDDALDRAVARSVLPTERPRWWRVVGVAQRLLAGALAVGLLWLLAVSVVAWLHLPDPPTVHIGELPLPSVLTIGGAGLGLLVAALARWATGVGARRRAAIARRRLVTASTEVGRELVIDPLDAELGALARLRELAARLRR